MQPAEDNHHLTDVSLCLTAEGFFMGIADIHLKDPK